MLRYYVRLALQSHRRSPGLSALMVIAIALGLSVCVMALAVFRAVSANPIWWKNDVLYAVTVDAWGAELPPDDRFPERSSQQLTWRDATALARSDIPLRSVATWNSNQVVESGVAGTKPINGNVRLTGRHFFAMFDVPFAYGGGWSEAQDQAGGPVIVLNAKTNEKLFAGANSVGRTVRVDGRDMRVVGVLDDWQPTPRFYDLNTGSFNTVEDAFIPLAWTERLQRNPSGNTQCWKDERIDSYPAFLGSECVWLQFWAELPDADSKARFQAFLDNYAREQKKQGRMARPLNNKLETVSEWLVRNEVVTTDNRMLVGLGFAFLAVCLLNVVGLLLAKFLGAAPQAGLRRALGAKRRDIVLQHLVEVVGIGLAGGVLGLLLSMLGLWGVRAMYAKGFGNLGSVAHLDWTMVWIALALSALAGLAAGLYPALRVGRVQPASYLKTQ